jgi:hypothetical protein
MVHPQEFTLIALASRTATMNSFLVLLSNPDATTQELRRQKDAKCFVGKPVANPGRLVCCVDELLSRLRL